VEWVKTLAIVMRLRRMLKLSKDDPRKIIEEAFKNAPEDVKEVVYSIMDIQYDGKSPREVAVELGRKLGIRDEDLDTFADTVVSIAEEVAQALKAELQ